MKLRYWINDFICWCLGHTTVSIDAIPELGRLSLQALAPKHIETKTVCLRCGESWGDFASNVFEQSPVQKAINTVPKWSSPDTTDKVSNQWP